MSQKLPAAASIRGGHPSQDTGLSVHGCNFVEFSVSIGPPSVPLDPSLALLINFCLPSCLSLSQTP